MLDVHFFSARSGNETECTLRKFVHYATLEGVSHMSVDRTSGDLES